MIGNEPLQPVKRTSKRAEIDENVKVHDFRHTFRTRMIQNGADLAVVKELMQHGSTRITIVYAYLNQDALRNTTTSATSRWWRRLASLEGL